MKITQTTVLQQFYEEIASGKITSDLFTFRNPAELPDVGDEITLQEMRIVTVFPLELDITGTTCKIRITSIKKEEVNEKGEPQKDTYRLGFELISSLQTTAS